MGVCFRKFSSHDSRANPTTAFRNFNNALAVLLDLGCSESHILRPETKNIAPLRQFYPEFSFHQRTLLLDRPPRLLCLCPSFAPP